MGSCPGNAGKNPIAWRHGHSGSGADFPGSRYKHKKQGELSKYLQPELKELTGGMGTRSQLCNTLHHPLVERTHGRHGEGERR
ncbi:hypothetical protein LIER_03016 [Lithospermum erythrorhizon]|uniref:Uncharacterized protein n=1 Tax=Lithospermum erythrorhizon TaxID=34254 RepID=A0AAV3NRN6_LITER